MSMHSIRISSSITAEDMSTYARFRRLSFCLSSRIFDAKPDSIARGALEVTD